MPAPIPASLDSNALALRLAELAGEEREVQVDFLLHLAEFDARRAYLEAGHSSLWAYCLEVLHLREGASGRRIGAMRVLVRFPRLEAALRDGRLSLSTIVVLGPVLTHENLDALLARAAFRAEDEPVRAEPEDDPHSVRRGAPRGLGPGRRPLHLPRRGRAALREPLQARVRSRGRGGAAHRCEPATALPSP